MALGHSGTHYWIGCTDRQIEGIWRWSDGSSLSYTNWAPTQPDNADGIQDCGILYSIYGYAQWDDTECSTPYFFICQTDINECSNDNGGCSHNCENTDGSYRCICQDGYQLSGLTDCRDINECSNDNGGCSHNCKNTDGSYRCICQDGYQLSGLTDCRDEDDKTPGTLENILSSVVPPITTIVVVILIVIAIIFAISKYKNKTTPDNSNSPPPPYSQRMAWK
ncbi:fibrillin-1-like isoform X1 [Branchiostoma floridae]|uniref:Fibrillin-1-like isoform X1 n=1 Tax=Branchiostoma floridae TaxID=7739 RepID=A0A9J7LSM5_BRAFL|nr:fibrillin-1-like isoform X1 [Branchiostoma floridae]